jgi:EmrB/QacA subfamily drug resistance transporter
VTIAEGHRKWWILAAMSGVLGLVVLDETVVGVALASIGPDLQMSMKAAHWVINAYFLTFTCLVAVCGRLADSLGRREFFVLGVAVFGLSSGAAGFAQTGTWLVAARAVQGVGAAILFPTSWAILTSAFPLEQRGFAFGIQTTVGGMFMALGPLVGGSLSQYASWRWIFWVNLPVVAAVAIIVWLAWAQQMQGKRSADEEGGMDWFGLGTLVGGLTALVVVLMEGEGWGWKAPATLVLAAAALVLLALFVLTETRRPGPLIELSLLANPSFTGGVMSFFMFQWSKLAVFVFVALYLQEVLKDSPINAGWIVMVAILPTLLTSLYSGKSADRFGSRRPLTAGLFLQGAALIVVGFAMIKASHPVIVAALVIWGAAMPFASVPARRALLSAVPRAQQGEASGVNLTIQMLGGTIGVALCGTLRIVTGRYASLFFLTGALLLAMVFVAWSTIERESAERVSARP